MAVLFGVYVLVTMSRMGAKRFAQKQVRALPSRPRIHDSGALQALRGYGAGQPAGR